jgi:hypothetical protein
MDKVFDLSDERAVRLVGSTATYDADKDFMFVFECNAPLGAERVSWNLEGEFEGATCLTFEAFSSIWWTVKFLAAQPLEVSLTCALMHRYGLEWVGSDGTISFQESAALVPGKLQTLHFKAENNRIASIAGKSPLGEQVGGFRKLEVKF